MRFHGTSKLTKATLRHKYLAFLLLLCGCSGIYESIAPNEKRDILLIMSPDFTRLGTSPIHVNAFIDVSPSNTWISHINVGEHLNVVAYQTTDDPECLPASRRPEFEGRSILQLCMTLELQPGASAGQRSINIELYAAGEPLVAKGDFFILRAYP